MTRLGGDFAGELLFVGDATGELLLVGEGVFFACSEMFEVLDVDFFACSTPELSESSSSTTTGLLGISEFTAPFGASLDFAVVFGWLPDTALLGLNAAVLAFAPPRRSCVAFSTDNARERRGCDTIAEF